MKWDHLNQDVWDSELRRMPMARGTGSEFGRRFQSVTACCLSPATDPVNNRPVDFFRPGFLAFPVVRFNQQNP